MSDPEMNLIKDTQEIIKFIDNHELKDNIIAMFLQGVPDDTGWMFCRKESDHFKAIQNKVLALNYDSSGFGVMMRSIEQAINARNEAK
tara:strand:+ start:321 stop:584 length:264 start_codon:yes stop_codon:yes gene_type:complete